MSYKITDPSQNAYPDISNSDTHFLILTKDLSLGISLYDTELAWKPIRWQASSLFTKKDGEPVNEYTHYITVRTIDIDYLRFSKDVDNLIFTGVKGDPVDATDAIKGIKEPILEFHDYIYDPAIGNFNPFVEKGFNYMIGAYDISNDYYFDSSWNGVVPTATVQNAFYELRDAPQFLPVAPSGTGGTRTNGPLFFPLKQSGTEFLIAKIAQMSSVIKKIESLGGTHRASLRARKWNDISDGNGIFTKNFFTSSSAFDVSDNILAQNTNAWKKMYLDLNDWADPQTDASFNLANFVKKCYRRDLKISSDAGFSTRSLLYLNKEIRVLQNLTNANSTAAASHSITKQDFQSYYNDGYRNFQMAVYIVDESYNTAAGSKVNPIEIILTFILPDADNIADI